MIISILAQVIAGASPRRCPRSGIIIFEQRRDIYRTISHIQPPKSHVKAPVSSKKNDIAHYWNKPVDQMFGPAIQALCSHRW